MRPINFVLAFINSLSPKHFSSYFARSLASNASLIEAPAGTIGNTLSSSSITQSRTTGTFELTADAEPQDGKAYYYSADGGTTFTYCVIYPQQTNPTGGDRLKVIDNSLAKILCTGSMKAVKGMEYYDMYTQNNGVYYAKIIKVQ